MRLSPSPHLNHSKSCCSSEAYASNLAQDSSGSCPPCSPTNCPRPRETPQAVIRPSPHWFRPSDAGRPSRKPDALIAFTREHRLSLNAVIAAAILLAEWQVRGTPHLPIPYLYIADLRLHLSPPLDATACTIPLGVAMYLAEITPNTDIAHLAGDIVEAFRADLSDGVIQQSLLHFDLQYAGTPSGLPDMVLATHLGSLPAPRTPPDVRIDGAQVEAVRRYCCRHRLLHLNGGRRRTANRSSFTLAGTGKDDRGQTARCSALCPPKVTG